jgi:hypothetical protein
LDIYPTLVDTVLPCPALRREVQLACSLKSFTCA